MEACMTPRDPGLCDAAVQVEAHTPRSTVAARSVCQARHGASTLSAPAAHLTSHNPREFVHMSSLHGPWCLPLPSQSPVRPLGHSNVRLPRISPPTMAAGSNGVASNAKTSPSPLPQEPTAHAVARRSTRSCQNCHQRKVGCDKRLPCSACARTGRTCTYPVPGPSARRRPRKTMSWMANRISDLERSLSTTAGKGAPQEMSPTSMDPSATKNRSLEGPTHSPTASTPVLKHSFKDEVLLQKGPQSQYFNEILVSRVMEEVSLSLEVRKNQVGHSDLGCLATRTAIGVENGIASKGRATGPLNV